MAWTAAEEARVQTIEKLLVEIKRVLDTLPTKRQLNAVVATIEPQIQDQQRQIDQLDQTGGVVALDAHRAPGVDEHLLYHTDIRGDIRYYTKPQSDDNLDAGLEDLAVQMNVALVNLEDAVSGQFIEVEEEISNLETTVSGEFVAVVDELDALDTDIFNTTAGLNNFIATKGEVSGLAELGADGKVPNAQLPALAITETFVVSGQDAMLALSQAEIGDVAIRTELSKSFILQGSDPSILGNWQELLTPPNAVTSVFGRVGNVAASSNDYPQFVMTDGSRIVTGTLTVSGQIVLGDNVPSITWGSDLDTGIFHYGNQIAFEVGGAETARVNGYGFYAINTGQYYWATRARIASPADATLRLMNNAENAGVRLNFATADKLQVRKFDDSTLCTLECNVLNVAQLFDNNGCFKWFTTGWLFSADTTFGWSSSNGNWNVARDVGLGRSSIGTLKVTDGSTGLGSLEVSSLAVSGTATASLFSTVSGITYIGSTGTDAVGGYTTADVIAGGKLQVKGIINAISGLRSGNCYVSSYLYFYGNNDFAAIKGDTNNGLEFYTGITDFKHQFVFTSYANATRNHDHAAPANPTLFIHSVTNPDTDNTQWLSFAHDQTNAVVASGKGDIVLSPFSSNVRLGTTLLSAPEDGTLKIGNADGSKTIMLRAGVYQDNLVLYNKAGTGYAGLYCAGISSMSNGTIEGGWFRVDQAIKFWYGSSDDAGIKRSAAGLVGITDGASGTGSLTALNISATNAMSIAGSGVGAWSISYYNAGHLTGGSNTFISFTDGNVNGTRDVGLARASAGVIKVTDGTTGAGKLQFGASTIVSAPADGDLVVTDATATTGFRFARSGLGNGYVKAVDLSGNVGGLVAYSFWRYDNSGNLLAALGNSGYPTWDMISTGGMRWGPQTTNLSGLDVGIGRASAGIIKITNGSTGAGSIQFGSLAIISSPSDGVLNVLNAAGTTAGTVQATYIKVCNTANTPSARYWSTSWGYHLFTGPDGGEGMLLKAGVVTGVFDISRTANQNATVRCNQFVSGLDINGGTTNYTIIDSYGVSGFNPTTDALPNPMTVKAPVSYYLAATNKDAAPLNAVGGIPAQYFTCLDNLSGVVTVTIYGNGTLVTLVSGTNFNLGTDNTPTQLQVTATNLAAAINGNGTLSPLMTASATSGVVNLLPKAPAFHISIGSNYALRISTTEGKPAQLLAPPGGRSQNASAISVPGISFVTDPTTGFQNYSPGRLNVMISGNVWAYWWNGYFRSYYPIAFANWTTFQEISAGKLKLHYNSIGVSFDVTTADTLKVRKFDDSGDASLTCGGITCSGLNASSGSISTYGTLQLNGGSIIHRQPGPGGSPTLTYMGYPTIRQCQVGHSWSNAMIVALGAVTSGTIELATLAAKMRLKDALVIIDTVAGGVATLTVSVGRTGPNYTDYITACDAKAGPSVYYGCQPAERGTNLTGYDLPSWTATTKIYVRFECTGGTLDQVTGSTGHIDLTTELMI
jgi:hypothetical protein